MSTMLPPADASPPATPGPSLAARTLRVFARPFQAWEGLENRATWWFPLVLVCVVQFTLAIVLYDRVMIPSALEAMRPKVESGQITESQAQEFATAPVSRIINLVAVVVITAAIPFVVALGLWFGVGFMLGGKFSYRGALEVSAWSSLVTVPAALVKYGLSAWQEVSINSIHLGLGALVPVPDPPEKLSQALAGLLDLIGPSTIWLLVVQVAGCCALSGARRANVAWVLSALYVVLAVIGAIVAYLLTPGA